MLYLLKLGDGFSVTKKNHFQFTSFETLLILGIFLVSTLKKYSHKYNMQSGKQERTPIDKHRVNLLPTFGLDIPKRVNESRPIILVEAQEIVRQWRNEKKNIYLTQSLKNTPKDANTKMAEYFELHQKYCEVNPVSSRAKTQSITTQW